MKKVKSGKRKSPLKSVDEYLVGVPEPARGTLKKIRAAIRSAAPSEATETISYRIPAFQYKGILVWFAAFSNHCSLFPTAAVIEKFKKELKGYPTSKGSIHFPSDKPLPAALVKKIVKARVAQIESKKRLLSRLPSRLTPDFQAGRLPVPRAAATLTRQELDSCSCHTS